MVHRKKCVKEKAWKPLLNIVLFIKVVALMFVLWKEYIKILQFKINGMEWLIWMYSHSKEYILTFEGKYSLGKERLL